MRVTALIVVVVATLAAGAVGAGSAPAPAELAFVGWANASDGSTSEIYRIRDDGTGLVRLTRNRSADASPVWSPDGQRILFVSNRDGDDDLYVMGRNGRSVRRLTHNTSSDLTPQWSPNGRLIAFASDRGSAGTYAIWVMRGDGTQARRIIAPSARPSLRGAQLSPTWSPDGTRIVFSLAVVDGNPELFVVRVDGTGLRRLTFTRGSTEVLGDDTMPDWSGNGRVVVFVSNRDGRSSDIWAMRPNGARQRPVVRRPAADDWNPRVSPDDARVAFTRYPLPVGAPSVWVMRLDGKGLRRVTAGAEPDWRPKR